MRVVFMGTPALAATVFEALAKKHDVVAVVTRPDAVRGRGNKAVASPVKEAALRHGIPVHEKTSLRDVDFAKYIKSLDLDAICVAACGIILPREILEIPRYGCINVHTSLLPKWRGAAPIERAILEEDETTGVCIMRMEEGLDTGDYCRRVEIPIEGATVAQLSDQLAVIGGEELLKALDEIEQGTVTWTVQAGDDITYAEKIQKGELSISPDDSANRAAAKVRASSQAHPARVEIANRTMAIEEAIVTSDEQACALCEGLSQGFARFASKRLLLVTRDGILEVLRVRPDGKKSMDARSFAGGIQGIKNMQVTWGRA